MIDVQGQLIQAETGDVALGEVCRIESSGGRTVEAEVIGFEGGKAVLAPYSGLSGVRLGSHVVPTGRPLTIRCGKDLRGVLLDGLGRPFPAYRQVFEEKATEEMLVDVPGQDPDAMPRISEPMVTGVRAIDGCLTLGQGQRIGLWAGLGVGQVTLLGQIARYAAADVVVTHLDAVPMREVLDYTRGELAEAGMARSIVVATSIEDPAIVRVHGLFVAQRIAEYFRDGGLKVLLLVQDVRSVADAQDELGGLLGEPEAPEGLAPSVYRMLSRVIGRAGNSRAGSITAVYGHKMYGPADPGAERLSPFLRRTVDGHIVMSRPLGARNHWPAIDVAVSLSRVMNSIAPKRHKELGGRVRRLFELYEQHREAIESGSYVRGKDAALDEAVERIGRIRAFLCQGLEEPSTMDETQAALEQVFA